MTQEFKHREIYDAGI